MSKPVRRGLLILLSLALPAVPSLETPAQEPAADDQTQAAPGGDLQWPRIIQDGDTTFTIYQPQIDKFDDATLEARAAVQVETKLEDDKKQTTYGVIWIKANTSIDKESRMVELTDIQIVKPNFPT